MTIAQAKKFYEQDQKKYDISKNKELLTWLKNAIENGYHTFTDIECLQELIDTIVYWYEIKYPEREMEFYEGTKYTNFENIRTLSKEMNLKQLMFRLNQNQLNLINCEYRSIGGGIRIIYNDKGEAIGNKTILFMKIDRKNNDCSPYSLNNNLPSFLLCANTDDGKVEIDYNLQDYINDENITLDELLILFKQQYKDKLKFTELEECIHDHNCDIELRKKILQLVALKLLYSNKTTPERGYERAKRFINEFNKKMNLNLTTKEIDEAINRNDQKLENTIKNPTDDNKKEADNSATKAKKSLIKTINLFKQISKKQ